MNIGILGTGGVGKAFASRLTGLGHHVMMGTRSVSNTMEKTGKGSFSEFMDLNPGVRAGTFSEAAAFGEMVINVSKGEHCVGIIKGIGAILNGKILVDISNPLDFSGGMPPSLIPALSNTNSLGEELQRTVPGCFVVKTLNTMWNGIMINPTLVGDGDHVNYICGNREEARTKVKEWLYELGWKKESVLDLGDITAARATEATLPIWLRIYGAKKTGAFNFNIVG